MKRFTIFVKFAMWIFFAGSAAAGGDPNDWPGSSDPPLFSRMNGFHISTYEQLEFDRFNFPVNADQVKTVEGRHTYVDYYANEGVRLPGALQITRNYAQAVASLGGQAVYEFEDGASYLTLSLFKEGAEIWALVSATSNGMYNVHVVEKQLMRQDVAARVDQWAGSIRTTGKAAVYGIYFDTGKSDIQPASGPTIAEIAKMLKADVQLELYVVGHTDNVGDFAYNVTLSRSRAAALVAALTGQHGIDAGRLTPFGAGPTSPAAPNADEEGRAKNRRVELVVR